MNVSRLRCDYMENPIGFDFDRPQLSWTVTAPGRNKRQSAYHLELATSEDFSHVLFDSGKTDSDQSVGVRLDLIIHHNRSDIPCVAEQVLADDADNKTRGSNILLRAEINHTEL